MPLCQQHDFEPEYQDPATSDEPLFITGPGSEYLTKTSARSAVQAFTFIFQIIAAVGLIVIGVLIGMAISKHAIIPSPPEARAAGNVPPPGF
jgi:hypothetical protein